MQGRSSGETSEIGNSAGGNSSYARAEFDVFYSPSKGEHLRNPQNISGKKEWTLGICHTQRAPIIKLHLPSVMWGIFFFNVLPLLPPEPTQDVTVTGEVMLRRTEKVGK